MRNSAEQRQRQMCERHRADFCPPAAGSKLGIARDVVRKDILPLNGLRHPVVGDTCGWYIWRGEELSEAEDYFDPMHVAHMAEECPEALEFLALPPGWRFLVAGDYVDVWYDESLLHVED